MNAAVKSRSKVSSWSGCDGSRKELLRAPGRKNCQDLAVDWSWGGESRKGKISYVDARDGVTSGNTAVWKENPLEGGERSFGPRVLVSIKQSGGFCLSGTVP